MHLLLVVATSYPQASNPRVCLTCQFLQQMAVLSAAGDIALLLGYTAAQSRGLYTASGYAQTSMGLLGHCLLLPSVSLQVLVADTPQLEHQLAEPYSQLLAALQKASKFDYILAPSTTFGKNLLPRAAALLDVQPLADIVQVVNNRIAEVSTGQLKAGCISPEESHCCNPCDVADDSGAAITKKHKRYQADAVRQLLEAHIL